MMSSLGTLAMIFDPTIHGLTNDDTQQAYIKEIEEFVQLPVNDKKPPFVCWRLIEKGMQTSKRSGLILGGRLSQ